MKKILLMGLGLVTLVGQNARADDRHLGGWHEESHYSRHYVPNGHVVRDLPGHFNRLFIGGLEFFYWEGMFYRTAAGHYVVVPAPVGAVVTTIPPVAPPVVVDGVPYYSINGATYMQTTYGYQVVPPPNVVVVNETPPPVTPAVVSVASGTPVAAGNDYFTVNIPNARGGYTPVVLKRSGNGFVGPQGEYYTEFPRVDQLKIMYGK